MAATRDKFYITTAISYPNGVPHIGHAYEAIATDAITRFERADGRDVLFLTGTDEHGLKMKQTALKEGSAPRARRPQLGALPRDGGGARSLHDDFIRTTEPRHAKACAEVWRRMEANGDIFLKTYGGWYSVRDEAYYNEAETEVGTDGIRRATVSGTPVEWNEEETYFFRLSAYQERLLAHYEAHPDFILPPERRNEVVSFVRQGLEDLRSRARRSTGAFRCRAIRSTSCTWSMP